MEIRPARIPAAKRDQHLPLLVVGDTGQVPRARLRRGAERRPPRAAPDQQQVRGAEPSDDQEEIETAVERHGGVGPRSGRWEWRRAAKVLAKP